MRGERLATTTAGWWGPAAFTAASLAAARRLPGYSARSQHVSGLAARGASSASTMVPGFVALGAGQLALGHALDRQGSGRSVSLTVAAAGLATLGAGLFPASTPTCPTPFKDPDATATDTRHALASVAAFTCWLAAPILGSSPGRAGDSLPAWHRRISRALVLPTAAAFAAAAATTQRRSRQRGAAQRAFLATAFAWQAATSVALITGRRATRS